jgi:O-antigen ligase
MKLTPHDVHPTDLIIDMPAPDSAEVVSSKPGIAWTETASLYGLIATLMWAPLAFGSTEPWSQFILRTSALALFGLWIARQHASDSVQIFPDSISRPILAFIGLVLFQLISGSTAYRYATLTESLHLLSYGIFALVAGDLFTRRHRLRVFIVAMAVYGFALAIFALVQGLSGTDRIYWLRTVDAISAAIYGPYANHNHYAGLMEMLIPLTAAAAFLQRGSKQVLLLFATAIMALSVALSRSRGGMIALAAELLFVCFVLFRSQRGRRSLLVFLGVCGAIAAFVMLLGSDKILDRFAETQDTYRLKIDRDTFSMALHKPILGYGLGTFSDVYPAYKSFYTNLFVNHAHNDYLEMLVDTGVVGLALFVWMLVGVFRSGFSKVMDRDDEEGRLLTLAALTGIVGILIHSFIDFNLHIPANAALFFVLCAAVAAPFKHKIKPAEFRPWIADPEEELEDASSL